MSARRFSSRLFRPGRTRPVSSSPRKTGLESLESRQMLDASFVVSELMALNTKTIRDEDNHFSDWIEIRNDGDTPGDLGGHYLTNNLGDLTGWQFPAGQSLSPGEHLVVFASGKNRPNVAEPHTDFTLDHAGGDVALVAPNGTTIVSQLADYPALVSDQSYGPLRSSVDATFVNSAAPVRVRVPTDNSLGDTWKGANEPFNDSAGAGWQQGVGSVGFDLNNSAPSFNVQVWYSTVAITTLAMAVAATNGVNVTPTSPFSATPQIVNYKDDPAGETDGNYANGVVFPGNTSGDTNNFAMKATTSFYIRSDQVGVWTIGFNSDDGGRLRIDGADIIVDDLNHAPTTFLGTANLTQGLHTLEYIYWEQGGGAEAELFAAQGIKATWDASFSLIGDPNGSLPLGGIDSLINTDIEATMYNQNASAYVRYPFNVANPADVRTLQFDITVDDGYVAYLNGVQVASDNAPAVLAHNSTSLANVNKRSFSIDLASHLSTLRAGTNVLAIHALNSSPGDTEYLFAPTLSGRALSAPSLTPIDLPTPGGVNGVATPVITEFQASNRNTIEDEDGEASDWIEIHNPGTIDLDLAGWSLTDDPLVPARWVFPATYVEAGDYLVVFASDKDRAVFGEELHTNFKIAAEGDYLALVRPDGTFAWEFNPDGELFAPQFADISYGLRGSAIAADESIRGLVAYWDFEDPVGSTVLTDRSGNGANGTLTNMDPASDWVTGRIGARALDFDGVNDFVTTLATATSLDITADSQRTIAGWVRGPAVGQGTNGAVFEIGTGTGEYAVRSANTAGDSWSVESGNESFTYTQSSPNAWYHLAVVYDGAATVVYINGIERTRNDNPDLDTGGAGTFNLGKRTATNLFFRGAVDDLAVWDTPLSTSAIASLAAATTTPLAVKTVNRPLGTTSAGYTVRQVNASASFPGQVTGEIGGDAGGGANALADADALLALSPGHPGIASEFSFQYDTINFRDVDGGGSIGQFGEDEEFPLDAEGVDENHFAVRATATLVVPAVSAGQFVFGIHSDEGVRLRIDGANVILDNTLDGANLNTGTVTLAAGLHTLELVYFERIASAELELSYKSRSNGFDNGDFQLLSIVPEQQLPPPPITVYDAPSAYFTVPTPGAANNVGVDVFVGPTSFSVPHGFYSGPIQVDILNATPGVSIYYTLNGTEPYLRNPTTGVVTPNGTLYSGPLAISSTTTLRAAAIFPGQEPSKVATATYLFLSDILTQGTTAPGPGWPAPTNAPPVNQEINYGMDPRIVNDPVWGPQMQAAFMKIPTMSIATDVANLFNSSTGIYVNPGNRGIAWERPISLEMIVPDGYTDPVDPEADQEDGFQVNAGLRIRGGFSRDPNNPKHAFRLFFRGDYGDSKLNFPLFGDEGVDEFDSFDLRTSQNYSWAYQNDGRNTMLRDELSRVLMGDMDQLYTRGRYYHLFINGTYWGLFNSEERPEADYAASYIGGNEENFDVVLNENPGNQGSGRSVGATDGTTEAYMRLWNAFMQPGGLSDANMDEYFRAQGMNPDGTRNPNFERLLDVDNLMDHMILTYYTNASDAAGSKFTRPGLNNWFAIYDRTNPDGFQHMVHDFEHAFDAQGASPAYNMVVPFVNNCGNFSTFNPHCQHELLMETNGVYAQQFVDRVYEVFFNDGPLATNRVVQRLDELAAQLDVAMIAESARWGDAQGQNPPFNLNTWTNAVATMRAWITTRTGTGGVGRVWEVIDQLRAVGWVPQVGAPIINPDGGRIDDQTEISIQVPGAVLTNDTTIVSGLNGQTFAKYLIPANNAVDGVWYTTAFNDASWTTGALGIGYEDNNGALDYPNITSTNVGSPVGGADVPIYLRIPFTMTSTDVDELILRMNYDDGFVAYLNGQEVARRNFTGTPTFSSLAGGAHNADPGGAFEDIDISSFANLLVSGSNLLAVHALNASASSDLFIQPALVSRTTTILDAAGQVYYTTDGSDPRGPDGNPSPTAVSYNHVEEFITPASTGKYLVPTSAVAGWQNAGFNDAGWSAAATSVGFDTGAGEIIGGFAVRVVDTTSGTIDTAAEGTAVLNGTPPAGVVIGSDTTRAQPHVDYGAGNFASDLPLFGTPDAEHYAIRATTNAIIPVGTWTINVGSDDGFRLTIPGVSFTAKYNTNGDPGVGTNTLVWDAPRGHTNTGGTFTVSGSPLTTTITLDFYEQGGGDSVELSIASGAQGAFAVPPFAILRDGQNGWSVKTTGQNVNYDPLVQTDVESAMLNQGSSLYLRYPFTVTGAAELLNLSFAATYDDGFVAYLNGVQVASRAAPASPTHTSVATTVRSDQESVLEQFIDLGAFTNLVVEGQNVLAIHVLNASSSNPDLLMTVELEGTFGGESFTLTDNTVIKARALLNGEWSAKSEAFFSFGDATLAISEINYHPAPPTAAETAAGISNADDFEFVELINIGPDDVDLAGVEFTGGITFNFTSSSVQVLPPGERVVIVRNLAGFNARYGATLPSGTRIAGVYSGSLSNGGESVSFVDGLGEIIQTFSYQDDWYQITDGGGFSLNIRDVYGDPLNWNERSGWRPSSATGGTPGADDAFTAPDVGDLIVNELLAATDAASRRIELLNMTLEPIDISGWYLSDDPADVKKYQLPVMPLVAPGEYRVIDELSTFGSEFSLSADGGMLVVHATDGTTNLAGFAIHRDYGASQTGVPLGRHVSSDGDNDFVALVSPTFGGPNSAPRVGPIVINEVHYGPSASGDEFIELLNISAEPVSLFDWSFSAGIGFTFPDVTLDPNELLVITQTTPAAFSQNPANRLIPPGVTVLGPFASGVLDNSGENLVLNRPSVQAGVSYVADRVEYDPVAPWPTLPAGGGRSIIKVDPTAYSNDPAHWTLGPSRGTPGQSVASFDESPPSVPTITSTTVLVGPSVTISWSDSIDPDSPVAGYRVTRNGQILETTPSTTFTDTTAVSGVNYVYSVSAFNTSFSESNPSVPANVRIMNTTSAAKVDATHVLVTFSENVSPATGNVPSNYHIGGLSITSAAVQTAANTVLLTVGENINDGQPLRLTIDGVTGVSGAVVPLQQQIIFTSGIGQGLVGSYYNDPNVTPRPFFTNHVLERVDAQINFNLTTWGATNPPAPGVGADFYSIRWLGRYVPTFTGNHHFRFTTNDGVRFWIDLNDDGVFSDVNERLINDWTAGGTTFNIVNNVALVAAQEYDIKIEYFEGTSTAVLVWEYSTVTPAVWAVVPSARLLTPGMLETTAPTVSSMVLDSSAWSPAFRANLASIGHGPEGIGVSPGGASEVLPWNNVDTIRIAFDSDVNVVQGDLTVSGASGALAVSSFSYDYVNFVGTWTLAQPLDSENVSITLAPTLADLAGNVVAGPRSATARVLIGDVNQDTTVNNGDFFGNLARQFTGIGHPNYSVLHDLDSNGSINAIDWLMIRDRRGSSLPAPSPSASPAIGGVADAVSSTQANPPVVSPNDGRVLTAGRLRLVRPAVDRALGEVSDAPPEGTQSLRARRSARRAPEAADEVFANF